MFCEDARMAAVVASMRYVKCNFTKHESPEGFLYETLSDLALINMILIFMLIDVTII